MAGFWSNQRPHSWWGLLAPKLYHIISGRVKNFLLGVFTYVNLAGTKREYRMDQKTLLALAQKTVATTWASLVRVYPGLTESCPTVALNARLKTTAGRSFYTQRKIDLSTQLFAEYPFHFVQDTIPHEVCHQAAWDLFSHHGHGEPWKRVMLSLGIQPQRCHQMTNTMWEAQKANRR